MASRLDELEGTSWAEWLARGVRAPGKAGAEGVKAAYGAWGDLQDRMINAMLQYNRGEGYDPGPALESAMLPVGGTAFSAPKGALGAGLTSPFPKKMDPEMAKALEKAGIKQGQSITEIGLKKYESESMSTEKALASIMAALRESSTSAKPTLAKTQSGATLAELEPISAPSIIRSKVPRHEFEPLDWPKQISPAGMGYDLPPEALAAGFNPNFPLYKGRASGKPNIERELPDPAKKDYERGLFFAEYPGIAAKYTPTGQGTVQAYVARAENPAQVKFDPKSRVNRFGEEVIPEYSEAIMTQLIDEARRRGHDLIKVKSLSDMGSARQNQLVVTKPEILRLPTAAFDPSKLKTNDILAGLAALGIVPAVTAQKGENNE